MGAINILRFPIPTDAERMIWLSIMPYEGLPHTLGLGPVNDGIEMAKYYMSRGYTVLYSFDATPTRYLDLFHRLLAASTHELSLYFSGHGSRVPDEDHDEPDGFDDVLVLYDEDHALRPGAPRPQLQHGVTNQFITDDVLLQALTDEHGGTRCVTITDCCHSGSMFDIDPDKKKMASELGHSPPPPCVITIGAAADTETAKQTVAGDGQERGVFTHNLIMYLNANPSASFEQVARFLGKRIKSFQDVVTSATDLELLKQSWILDQ